MDDPSAALSALDTSLASLEAAVAPLLARSRASTLDAVGKVDKAKMDVLLAFAINNLVWVYLKSRGIDPESHDVTRELERIQTYYGKVRAAEAPQGGAARSRVDIPAASRIIKHSLPSRRTASAAAEPPTTSAAATARAQAQAHAAVGKASRFRFVAKEGEKMIPGGGAEEMEMDVDGADDGNTAAEAEASNLLDAVEADIVAAEVAQTAKSGSRRKGGKAAQKTKRKRTTT